MWFTDGLKMEDKTGVDIFNPKCLVRKASGCNGTFFQVEILVIDIYAHLNLVKGS